MRAPTRFLVLTFDRGGGGPGGCRRSPSAWLGEAERKLSPTLSWEERESGGEMGIAEFLADFSDRRCGQFEKGQGCAQLQRSPPIALETMGPCQ